MAETPQKPELIILEDLPTECDTCGEEGPFAAIKQKFKTAFGDTDIVVGYECPKCETSHLYR